MRLGDHCLVYRLRIIQDGLLFVAAVEVDAVVVRHPPDILQRRVRRGDQRDLAVDHQANILRRILRNVSAGKKVRTHRVDHRLDLVKQRVPIGALSVCQRGQQLLELPVLHSRSSLSYNLIVTIISPATGNVKIVCL